MTTSALNVHVAKSGITTGVLVSTRPFYHDTVWLGRISSVYGVVYHRKSLQDRPGIQSESPCTHALDRAQYLRGGADSNVACILCGMMVPKQDRLRLGHLQLGSK